ncbi:hypothetical protein DRE_00149 [Drechslerella stenobrocha 248]|uniref:Uncharacterized protein n=1 Tax=Drechslerella stenobrocha 248 TaxID=1043628 RepID=W7HZ97_9PEZI|nr:hypothetical protein DRE_00149 [Drechslerella stenobrocha 248]
MASWGMDNDPVKGASDDEWKAPPTPPRGNGGYDMKNTVTPDDDFFEKSKHNFAGDLDERYAQIPPLA